jgi:hypothetical protein
MPDFDEKQTFKNRRWAALRAFNPLLAPVPEVSNRNDAIELYQFAGETIGKDTAIRYLEFGVYQGRTMRQISGIFSNPESRFTGFDSFEGLPEPWGHFAPGKFSTEGALPPNRDQRVRFVKGWFQNTLPGFLAENRGAQAKTTLVHFDADLYSSTLFLLSALWFDIPEYYFMYDEFHYDEVVALHDFISAFPVKLEFFAKTPGPMQVFGRLVRTEFSLPERLTPHDHGTIF